MHFNLIENFHMENVVLGKDFSLGMIGSFFHAFILMEEWPFHINLSYSTNNIITIVYFRVYL
jgi:hypothetical protein